MRATDAVGATTPSALYSGNPVLELQGVTAGYGDLSAIRDISLALCPGEVVALFEFAKSFVLPVDSVLIQEAVFLHRPPASLGAGF